VLDSADDQALVFQVLDEDVAGRSVLPRYRAIIPCFIDRQPSGPATAAEVRLRVVRNLDFPAKVQWVEGHEAGGSFLEPISFKNEGT
jgi:hypothetical protein